MKFRHQEISVEITRTPNASGCSFGNNAPQNLKLQIASAIRERRPGSVKFDGYGRINGQRTARFLFDGQLVEFRIWVMDGMTGKYYRG